MFSHKFSAYCDYLGSSFSDIVLIHDQSPISTSVLALYNHWDAEVRYYYDAMPKVLNKIITYPNVKAFNDHAISILESIKIKSLGR